MKAIRVCAVIAALLVLLCFSSFAAAPVILSQPQNYFIPAGTDLPTRAYFSVLASGDDLSYRWQYQSLSGNWVNGTGTDSSYNPTIDSTNVNGVRKFRVIVSNSDGSVVSSVVSVEVGAYFMDSVPQMLSWLTQIGGSIFDTVGLAASTIVSTPLLLLGVSFFALGASIAILYRLLSRS